MVRSPRFDTAPSFCFPPLDFCNGLRPRHAVFSHEAVRDWEAKLTRPWRRNSVIVDVAISAAAGTLTRHLSKSTATGDICIGPSTAMAPWWTRWSASAAILPAAKAFFRSARTVTGVVPDRVTTDGHDAYPGRSGANWVKRSDIGPKCT